jgi:hypothetical protein
MNAPTPLLEQRLRRGLSAAADAVPPVELTRGGRAGRGPSGRGPRRRWLVVAVGSAAAVVAGALVAAHGGDGGPRDVVTETDTDVAQPGQDTEVAPANGHVPGQAVVVGDELRTYGPDGAQTGAVSLAPLEDVQAVSSDLTGGWVGCGLTTPPADSGGQASDTSFGEDPGTGATPSGEDPGTERAAREASAMPGEGTGAGADSLLWFPADGEPTPLTSTSTFCSADAVQVVDAPEGPTAIYDSFRPVDPEDPDQATGELHAVVLSTGEDRPLGIDFEPGDAMWAVSTGRLLVQDTGGVRLLDIATGDELPLGDVTIDRSSSDLVLSPDATSAAWLTGDPMQDATDLVVVDLATGAERYRETFPMSLEGAQLSYDGTTVAVGNFYEGHDAVEYPPVTVFDLADPQARRTIDVHGTVL